MDCGGGLKFSSATVPITSVCERHMKMITAAQMLDLLATVLTDDPGSKSRIRADYSKFKPKMTDADARLLASLKYLRSMIDDSSVQKPKNESQWLAV
jgi:hypothetical protein